MKHLKVINLGANRVDASAVAQGCIIDRCTAADFDYSSCWSYDGCGHDWYGCCKVYDSCGFDYVG